MPWRSWPRPQDDPAIFHEIARHPEIGAVLHLPLARDASEARFMYYSTLHWKPIANGYSGFASATYLELRERVHRHLLDVETIDRLLELGVTHVAVHPDAARAPRVKRELAEWERRFGVSPTPRIRLVASAGPDRLYELLPRGTPT
jgi:hypothetical protein